MNCRLCPTFGGLSLLYIRKRDIYTFLHENLASASKRCIGKDIFIGPAAEVLTNDADMAMMWCLLGKKIYQQFISLLCVTAMWDIPVIALVVQLFSLVIPASYSSQSLLLPFP
jgi:hypothetical protein